MTQTFTQNHLVHHLFTEESIQQAVNMENLLIPDAELTEKIQDYSDIKKALNSSLLDPSPDSVNFIREYSRITSRI